MTEAGGTRLVHELSQYSQIPLSEIHKPLGSVQAVFLDNYAVHSIGAPVAAQLWQIAGVCFHREPCASLRARKPDNCEDLGADQISVSAPPLGCVQRKQKVHALSQGGGLIS